MSGVLSPVTSWGWHSDLAIGADFYINPGGPNSTWFSSPNPATQNCFCCHDYKYFAIDVITDDLVEIEIQVGHTTANLIPLATLICPAVLQHNTTYDLPAPMNRDGFLVICGHWMRLRVRNTSGNVVSPFNLTAKIWN